MRHRRPTSKATPRTKRRGDASAETLSLSRRKKLCFCFCALVAVLALMELGLRAFGVETLAARDDPYVGFRSGTPLFVPTRDEHGRTIYRTAKNKLGFFNDQSFPATKPSRAYRIFCLGGSTTHGHPYRDPTSYCGWLRAFLNGADPSRTWEVINAGGVSYASYREARLMEELVGYEPDLFIIYAGHNEFLERRTYAGIIDAHPAISQLQALFYRSRVVSVMRSLADTVRPNGRAAARKQYQMTGEVAPLLEVSAGLDLYHRDDSLQKQIVAHFRFNLGRMAAIARAAGADVLFVQPPVNLRDFSPFKSQHRHGLSDGDLTLWRGSFDQGLRAVALGDFPGALVLLRRAEQVDDRYAQLQYELGRVLFEMGRYEEARRALERAVAEDVCPLRILPEMNTVLSEVAEHQQVEVIDFREILEEECYRTYGHRLLGNDYFLDHVHPTIEAHQLLGSVLLGRLVGRGIALPTSDWDEAKAEAVRTSVYASVDSRDHALARGVLAKVLRWAGKVAEADRLLGAAGDRELLGQDAEYVAQLGASLHQRGRFDEAAQHYRRALELNPELREARINLGMLLMDSGALDESVTHFQEAVRQRPEYAVAYYYLGHAYSRQRKLSEALEQFRRSIEVDALLPDAHASLGEVLLRMNAVGEAIVELEAELRQNSGSVRARNLLATAFLKVGRSEEAVEQYELALRVDPDTAEILHNLGLALMGLGRVDSAIEHYRRALEQRPESGETHFRLGLALLHRGRLPEATGHLERVLNLASIEADACVRVAEAYAEDGRFALAIGVLKRGLEVSPADVRLLTAAAWLLATCPDEGLRSGTKALDLAREANRLSGGSDVRSLDALAAAYAENGGYGDAVETIQKAIGLATSAAQSELLEDLRRRLELYRDGRPYRQKVP